MATVEQPPLAAGEGIPVENPATGAVIATVPVASPDEVRALVARARAAQPAWEALGFDGRAAILRRAQKWVTDNQDRIVETIVSETGKTHDDALINEIGYAATAFGFWAKNAAGYLADEKVRTTSPFVLVLVLPFLYGALSYPLWATAVAGIVTLGAFVTIA